MDAIFRYISKERYDVTSLSFIVMNDNTGESQTETQIRKNVNKYTNIIIVPVIYCSHWFSIACYLKEKIIFCFDSLYTKIKVNVFERVLFIMSFILNKIEVSYWLLLQPLNLPKQVYASSCGIHAILNIWFLLQLGDTYNQADIVNSRIWFAIQILNMSRKQDRIKKLDLKLRGITNRLKLKLSKKDIGTGVHIFINKMSPFNSLKEIIASRKKS